MRFLVLLASALSAFAADYVTYIGDAYSYHVTAMTTDAGGNTYLTGGRAIVVPPPTSPTGPLTDVFVSKVDAAGNVTVLATFSGKGSDQANSIALDPSGNIYVVGNTTSTNFPLHNPFQGSSSGSTGFLVKMSSDGTILYSTYLGGTLGPSVLNAVAADSQGNAYVTGETYASDYPRTAGLPAAVAVNGVPAISVALFAKISPAGDHLIYAGGIRAAQPACVGSCGSAPMTSAGRAIALDPTGNAYIAGNTNGVGFPTTPGVLESDGIGAFVFKVNADGASLGYVTMLGAGRVGFATPSIPANLVYGIAADASGAVYLAGSTADPSFPATVGAFQTTLSVPNPPPAIPLSDAFVAKLNSTGSAMAWATFLGGTGADQASHIALDSAGDVWVTGTTASADFPASGGVPGGNEFVAELNPSGSSLLYGARFPTNSVSAALALDPAGVAHLASATGVVSTLSSAQNDAPRIFGAANAALGTLSGRVAPGEVISLYGLHLGPATPASANFDANGFLPFTLAGAHFVFNDTAAPLIYVSDTQINLVVPQEVVPGSSARLRISINNSELPDFRVMVDTAIPEVARHTEDPTTVSNVAAINQDGTVNSPTNPAKAGSFVSIWATGVPLYAAGLNGQMATAAQPECNCLIRDEMSNQDILPSYAGAAPGMVTGVVQINFQVPATASQFYDLRVAGAYSSEFKLFTTP